MNKTTSEDDSSAEVQDIRLGSGLLVVIFECKTRGESEYPVGFFLGHSGSLGVRKADPHPAETAAQDTGCLSFGAMRNPYLQ